ncbi:hypothetical protein AWZ03_006804 [Drosophila navojoa]|uniref:Uncharacterized protein n=1 Tax=Drosophila navojoa TaxID=7232 RepID=A0A484BD33_DRONA|nr:hypothetical protein AWZ03_006804 [Drosophila navojoa]
MAEFLQHLVSSSANGDGSGGGVGGGGGSGGLLHVMLQRVRSTTQTVSCLPRSLPDFVWPAGTSFQAFDKRRPLTSLELT